MSATASREVQLNFDPDDPALRRPKAPNQWAFGNQTHTRTLDPDVDFPGSGRMGEENPSEDPVLHCRKKPV